ncbi:MAG TPA: DUF1501 domain-containing protein [Pirellulales bacterium]|nr:DUF1501 domain-containing protein [Pirellulales bacterium]
MADFNPLSGITRRDLLRIGGLGFLGLNLAELFRAEAAEAGRAGDGTAASPIKSCILLYQTGGPSHLDTWDLKPDAPREVRGEFKSVSTSVPGLGVCEHLPRLASLAHRLAIVRSMHHRMRDHNAAATETLCGHTPLEGDIIFHDGPNSYPCFGSVLSRLMPQQSLVPPHVALPQVVSRLGKLPGQGPGFLGDSYSPFQLSQDPNAANFGVPELTLPGGMPLARLEHRRSLSRLIDQQVQAAETGTAHKSMDAFRERAFDLLRSDAVRQGFDIAQEDQPTRERYGRHRHGQSLLLARRLVEAGVRFVTVNSIGDPEIGGGDDWDTHSQNFSVLKDDLLPKTDQAFSALIEDLEARGLLDSTLIIWIGEFGRSPTVTKAEGGGRDHWPDCFSMVLAGGGVKGGIVYGTSDKQGAYPNSDPVSSGDLAATLFWRFRLDPASVIHDRLGRPIRVGEGEPVRKLFL